MLLDDEKDPIQEQEENVPTPETHEEPAAEAVAEATEEVAAVVAAETEAAVEAVEETTATVEAETEAAVEAVEEVPAVEETAPAEEAVEEAAPVAEAVEEATPVAEAAAEEAPAGKAAEAAAPAADHTDEEDEEDVELPVFDAIQAGGAHDDFNWNVDKRGAIVYSSEEKAALLKSYDKALHQIEENQVIKGRVSAISGGDVVLDINYKSDGLIPMSEFRDTPGLAPGDSIEVFVESQEDSQGQLGLSRRKAKILRAWESIVDSFKNGTIIRGSVISKTKGGLIVDCNGLETFLPGSQIDIKPVMDYDQYVGKMMEFKVVKVNEQIKNAVVSHKALIESDLAEQREQILGSLEKGQVLEGIVKNITDFGAFLDLGGVDGLLYITDISWGRINHPTDVLSLNQRINVVVLDFDENKKRISLGLKQLTPHPWEVLPADVGEGSIVT
ncbi:MAG: S1 RNA-binding domain-containing protein, partial [Saprospiraceae bacterium]|nr:S1 RNA-binding domain-containing protein [Saprospiraceae bacterium]